MTTQTAAVALSNNQMSKLFAGTATDGVWTNLQDSLSQTNLGILIPNAMINRAIGTYTGGVGAFRIINAQTLAVSRRGWLAEDGIRDRSPSRGLGDVYKRQVLRMRFEWSYFHVQPRHFNHAIHRS